MTPSFPTNRPLFLLVLMLSFGITASAQWPYNPNADGDTLIGTGDVLELLTLFGLPWEDEGVLGLESGGTGAASAGMRARQAKEAAYAEKQRLEKEARLQKKREAKLRAKGIYLSL